MYIRYSFLMRANPKIEIRQIKSEEYAVCAEIYSSAWNFASPDFQRTISVIDFESEIDGELTLVAILDDRIVGYISIDEPEWFIHHLYVEPLVHGSGIGTALVTHLEELAVSQKISLKCLSANSGAMRFYKTLGFTEASESGVDIEGHWVRLTKILL